jgi:hypothetical protein
MLKRAATLMAALFLIAGVAQAQHVQNFTPLVEVGPVHTLHGFPIWYQDSTGLQLELCTDPNDAMCAADSVDPNFPFSQEIGFGAEAFWWLAEAEIENALGPGLDALLGLALEATWGGEHEIEPGNQIAFGRVRIRIDVAAPGDYTVIHPFGTYTQTISQNEIGDGREIDFTADIGIGDFEAVLAGGIGPFLRPSATPGGPALPPIISNGNAYISNPLTPVYVTGRPDQNNFFEILFNGDRVAFTDQFFVMGKVANCSDTNLHPIASPDFGAALGGMTTLAVLANDEAGTIDIDPGGITIDQQGTLGTAMRNPDGTVTYTPNPGASGVDIFNYTARDFCGLPSESTPITLFVEPEETIEAERADYRSRTGKWHIEGTSDLVDPVVRLSGGEEVPPVTTEMSGFALVEINAAGTAIDYDLMIDRPADSDVTVAHIHIGPRGENGPPIFFLCGGGTQPQDCPDPEGVVSGTLMSGDLIPRPLLGIETFADAVAVIRAGNTYINVHTSENTAGEIRGQIGNFVELRTGAGATVGSGVVQPDLSWSFQGKSIASPGVEPRTIEGTSIQGKEVTIPLRMR